MNRQKDRVEQRQRRIFIITLIKTAFYMVRSNIFSDITHDYNSGFRMGFSFFYKFACNSFKTCKMSLSQFKTTLAERKKQNKKKLISYNTMTR